MLRFARRLASAVMVALVVVLAANVVRLGALHVLGAGPSGRPSVSSGDFVPYTVVIDAIWHPVDRPAVVRWQETYALRSDGAYVRRYEGTEPKGPFVNRIIVLANGSPARMPP